jgi:Tol biopolymer transport system component
MKLGIGVGIAAVVATGVLAQPAAPPAGPPETARETHLAEVKQLTFGGENAEAYFSFDGRELVFQSTRDGAQCDQIFAMKIDGTDLRRVSSGEGRTTCGYYTPDGSRIVYASTHLGGRECPPRPDFSRGYVWPVYDAYDIFSARPDGTDLKRLTATPGYDAEATIGPDGRIVFTSVRDGDMEIYSMAPDGSDVKRLTTRKGPDGGAFFSRDGRQIVFRGRALSPGPELDDYMVLLRDGLWRPTSLELFVMNTDGSGLRQVTSLEGASFAPFFTPDGKQIIFSSNQHNPRGRDFELWLINVDGTGLERVTYNPSFDGFPMFSPDGTKLVFASNRFQKASGETNVFIATWKP